MGIQSKRISEILNFIKTCERLKTELRHSRTSDPNRRESVAEHSWMMSLIALVLFEEIQTQVDRLKTLKMIIIHDLVEVLAGDTPIWAKTESRDYYYQLEKKALEDILQILPEDSQPRQEILDLWTEFEQCRTPEAKLAKAIDKSEVLIQHNLSKLDNWNEGAYQHALREGFYDFDPFLRAWKDQIDRDTVAKVEAEGRKELLDAIDLQNHHGRLNGDGPRLSMIAAISENRVIGSGGELPWNIPGDMKRMKKLTMGHPIIMGRKTYESIGRPLPGRSNVIVTTRRDYQIDGALVVDTLDKALAEAKKLDQEEIFIFGGGEIYKQSIHLADRLYLTLVEGEFEGDAYFPDYGQFNHVLFQELRQENGYRYQFLDLEKSAD
jgi:dihydrofolate reductase